MTGIRWLGSGNASSLTAAEAVPGGRWARRLGVVLRVGRFAAAEAWSLVAEFLAWRWVGVERACEAARVVNGEVDAGLLRVAVEACDDDPTVVEPVALDLRAAAGAAAEARFVAGDPGFETGVPAVGPTERDGVSVVGGCVALASTDAFSSLAADSGSPPSDPMVVCHSRASPAVTATPTPTKPRRPRRPPVRPSKLVWRSSSSSSVPPSHGSLGSDRWILGCMDPGLAGVGG
ncbi:MAG: hypothetical protein B7733_13210 [Myxococcales bacterium FL481]|nr:MAG: hypothetical protein B7733_13210 [Myxococcales bacterium FL481]